MTDAMRCEWFRDHVLDYVDGEISRFDLGAFRRHYSLCAPCAEALRTVEGQAELLAALPRPHAPRDLGARIEAAVSDRRLLARRPSPAWRWAGLAAAAALLLALGLSASRGPAPARDEVHARALRVVDVELPGNASVLGRLVPSYEHPGASPQEFLSAGGDK